MSLTQPLDTPGLIQLLNEDGVEAFNQYRRDSGYEILDLSGVRFEHMDLKNINLSNATLSNCVFLHCYLENAKTHNCLGWHKQLCVFALLFRKRQTGVCCGPPCRF